MGEYKDRHLEIEDEQGRPMLVCTCGDTIPIHWKFLVSPHYYITCVCGLTYRKVNEWVESEHPYKGARISGYSQKTDTKQFRLREEDCGHNFAKRTQMGMGAAAQWSCTECGKEVL